MTPNLSTAFHNYGQIHARSVKTIMARLNSEPIFADRLLSWLDDCSKSPLEAVDPKRAKTAMCDIVALRVCCYGFSGLCCAYQLTNGSPLSPDGFIPRLS
jgi:hypothetical protein